MFTKAEAVLAAALLAVTSTVALATSFDPNPANRYPSYASPSGASAPYLGIAKGVVSQDVARRAPRALQSAPVRLKTGRSYTGQRAPSRSTSTIAHPRPMPVALAN